MFAFRFFKPRSVHTVVCEIAEKRIVRQQLGIRISVVTNLLQLYEIPFTKKAYVFAFRTIVPGESSLKKREEYHVLFIR